MVTFLDGSTVLGTSTLDATGHATLSTAALPLGTGAISASYAGSLADSVSTSPATQLYVSGLVKHDFDGDGKADPTVYGKIPGTNLYGFTTLTSSSNFTKTVVWDNQGYGFGNAASIPVVGDFFGDGRDDYAIWSPDGHGFMMLQVISSVDPTKTLSIDFGLTSDVPVVADGDGDGKADFGVYGYDPNLGYRYDFLPSSKNFSTSQPLIFNNYGYGTPNAMPVVADFDKTGHAGFGVYIPSGTGGPLPTPKLRYRRTPPSRSSTRSPPSTSPGPTASRPTTSWPSTTMATERPTWPSTASTPGPGSIATTS